MNRFVRRIALGFVALLLSACANQQGSAIQGRAPLPGDAQFYSYGISQSKENFANVVRAQSHYALFLTERHWVDIEPFRAPAMVNVLQTYYPLHVRWEMKDGRQFILENIDVAAIMREYFKTHRLELPHQREHRLRAEGDSDPSLVHEVRDDTLIIKWLIRINNTPLPERRTSPPRMTYEEFPVIELKGRSTAGIDFEKRWEFNKVQKARE
jgi:hypothetical protein